LGGWLFFIKLLAVQNTFGVYLQLGFEHISDLTGYDHILFIIALCAVYQIAQWKKVLLLATAFTIGHSVTLAMVVLNILPVNSSWIEFLIPVTIICTALYNTMTYTNDNKIRKSPFVNLNYWLALVFGFIHGMGFSNFLRASLLPGEESQLWLQLLAFNLGVELGQFTIVLIVLIIAYLMIQQLRIAPKSWNLFISGAAFGLALVMALERIPNLM
jgi:hypothetical protein